MKRISAMFVALLLVYSFLTIPTHASVQTLGTLPIGSTVSIKCNNGYQVFTVIHQGQPSTAYGNNSNGTWLLGKSYVMTSTMWNASDDTYATSNIHTYLNDIFYNSIDSSVRGYIKQITIPTYACSNLQAYVFALSGTELCQSNSYTAVEGSNLSYFSGSANLSTFTGVWTRTRECSDSRYAWSVVCHDSGDNYDVTTWSYSRFRTDSRNTVLPAMVMDSSVLIDNSTSEVLGTANYTTQYYQQNISDDNYTLVEDLTLNGTISSNITSDQRLYTGFHESNTNPNNMPSGNILSDGSLVLKRYYDRDTFTATFNVNGGSPVTDITGIRYNSTLSSDVQTNKSGYNLISWCTDDMLSVSYDFNSKVTSNIKLYAKWSPRADTAYKVEFYKEG